MIYAEAVEHGNPLLLENNIADLKVTPTESYSIGGRTYVQEGAEFSYASLQRFCHKQGVDMLDFEDMHAVDKAGNDLYTVKDRVFDKSYELCAQPLHVKDGHAYGTAVTKDEIEKHLDQVGGWDNVERVENYFMY